MTYTGPKYYCKGEDIKKDYNIWWEDQYYKKANFAPTQNYINWLKEKQKKDKEEYIKVLRLKLEHQYKEYGEVDEVDFNEYMDLIKG